MLKLMLITNSVSVAEEAKAAGINRIFVDLEQLGKRERQGHLDTHIADHHIEDVRRMRKALPETELLVRTNPLHDDSQREIDEIVTAGADVVMLPMFQAKEEVMRFVSIVNGRAKVNLLLETPQALVRLPSILDSPGVEEVHLGLNDLHLALGLEFMFELLSGGIVDYVASVVKGKGLVFGFGGIARLGQGQLPAELILSEHVRIGSEMVILSRTFHQNARSLEELHKIMNLKEEISKLRDLESKYSRLSKDELEANAKLVKSQILNLVSERQF